MRSSFRLFGLVLALIVLTPLATSAQGPSLPSAPEQTPVDGGLGLLALAGGALAAKRLRGRDMHDV